LTNLYGAYNNDLFPNSVTRDEELANDCNVLARTPELEDAHIQWWFGDKCKLSHEIAPQQGGAFGNSVPSLQE